MKKIETPAELLKRLGLSPKHSWGQNFLGDDGILEAIADEVAVGPGDVVVELGAGLGHFTRHLKNTGARVLAVERDRELVPVLEKQGFEVLAANAAELEFAQAAGVPQVVVAGNLPYHLSSMILFALLEQRPSVKRGVFLLQKEVVTRLAAPPGGREYGLLSVLLGLWFDVRECFDVPRGAFHPPPNVDSAVVRLDRRTTPRAEGVDDAWFRTVVKAAFAHRRKTLKNSLSTERAFEHTDVAQALATAGVDGIRRAETLSVEEFAAITRALPKPPAS